tara:strand:- start:234 stop:710 length:477 start_codon:yes stop_codon:yes gene_type:complete
MKVDFVAEVPKGTKLKYELDDGVMRLDRIINTPLTYPETYGYITNTLAGDGDPLDALLIGNHDILPGTHVYARPVGVLDMRDEAGQDEKILLVPDESVDPSYLSIQELDDLDQTSILLIKIFFQNYKNSERDRWSIVNDIHDRIQAESLIKRSLVSRM